MERLPHQPKSLPHIRSIKTSSPTSIRILKQVVSSRDTSKFINLTSTLTPMNKRPTSEGHELSFQLTTLRKTLDRYSLLKTHKEKKLEELRLKLQQIKVSELVKDDDIIKENYYHKLKQDIKNIKVLECDEIDTQKIYENMYQRMSEIKRFLEKKEKKLRKALEISIHNADIQSKKRKEVIDSVNQYKIVYKTAENTYNYETSTLKNEISRLKTQSKLKKSVLTKTEEHNKHRLDIIEQTMIDERSAHLDQMRNGLLMSKYYNKFLSQKLVTIKQTFNKLDEAFQKVRIKTGLSNVDEVIEKFLTQESNYQLLTFVLHQKEEECSDYKAKLFLLQANVNELNDTKLIKNKDSNELKRKFDEFYRVREKKREIDKIFLKINIWVDNTTKKINPEQAPSETLSLKEKFGILKNLVSDILKNQGNQKERYREIEEIKKNFDLESIVETYHLIKKVKKSRNEKNLLSKTTQKIKILS